MATSRFGHSARPRETRVPRSNRDYFRQRAVVIAAPPGLIDDECAAAVEDHQRVILFDDVSGGVGEGAANWAGTLQRPRSHASMR